MFGLIDVNETPRLPRHSQPLYEAERERRYSCSIESGSNSREAGSLTHQFCDAPVFTAHMMAASMSSAGWRGEDRPRLSNPSHHQSQAYSDAIRITEMFTHMQSSSPLRC